MTDMDATYPTDSRMMKSRRRILRFGLMIV